jgi:hypothetical protein
MSKGQKHINGMLRTRGPATAGRALRGKGSVLIEGSLISDAGLGEQSDDDRSLGDVTSTEELSNLESPELIEDSLPLVAPTTLHGKARHEDLSLDDGETSNAPAQASVLSAALPSPQVATKRTHRVTNTIRMTCRPCKKQCYITFHDCRKDWFSNEAPEDLSLDVPETSWELPEHERHVHCANRYFPPGKDRCVWTGNIIFDWAAASRKEKEVMMKVKYLVEEEDRDIWYANGKWEVWEEELVDWELMDALKVSEPSTSTFPADGSEGCSRGSDQVRTAETVIIAAADAIRFTSAGYKYSVRLHGGFYRRPLPLLTFMVLGRCLVCTRYVVKACDFLRDWSEKA